MPETRMIAGFDRKKIYKSILFFKSKKTMIRAVLKI